MYLMTVVHKIREHGLRAAARKVSLKLFPRRSRPLIPHLRKFRNRKGLEIGGPSGSFGRRGLAPIYPVAQMIDNVNYAASEISILPFRSLADTTRDAAPASAIRTGKFKFDKKKPFGTQFFCEASDLSAISDHSYDFLISSHMIEHTANPIKVLIEWSRVVKPDGIMLIIAPNKEATFDHNRLTTSLSHMIEDFEIDQNEDDLTHLDDSINNTDFDMQQEGLDSATFDSLAKNNFETRYIHHHTFTLASFRELLEYMKFEVIELFPEAPHHLIALIRSRAD